MVATQGEFLVSLILSFINVKKPSYQHSLIQILTGTWNLPKFRQKSEARLLKKTPVKRKISKL